MCTEKAASRQGGVRVLFGWKQLLRDEAKTQIRSHGVRAGDVGDHNFFACLDAPASNWGAPHSTLLPASPSSSKDEDHVCTAQPHYRKVHVCPCPRHCRCERPRAQPALARRCPGTGPCGRARSTHLGSSSQMAGTYMTTESSSLVIPMGAGA